MKGLQSILFRPFISFRSAFLRGFKSVYHHTKLILLRDLRFHNDDSNRSILGSYLDF